MNNQNLKERLLEFVKPSYPEMLIDVIDRAGKRELYFTEKKFAALYPMQRYHYLINLVPTGFYESELANTVWFELAPGEQPGELDYFDKETADEIKETVLDILKSKTGFVDDLDKAFLNKEKVCHGDFSYSKEILTRLKFATEEQFDIFHVLMFEGAYCDCEILYNVFRESGYAKKYWKEGPGSRINNPR